MLKKTITYTDFNEKTVSEEFRFHLSKAELIELEVTHQGGLSAHLTRIIETNDGSQIIGAFKKLILDSYGTISEDGKRFAKSAQQRSEFQETEAYSQLFIELATDADAAAEFVNGIMPAGLEADLEKIGVDTKPAEPQLERQVVEETPVLEDKGFSITKAEAEEMDHDELMAKVVQGYRIED